MDDKLTGSFYTPIKLIEYMVSCISGVVQPRNILEPSAGDGRFIPYLSAICRDVTAIELCEEKVEGIEKLFDSQCEVVCADFLEYAVQNEKKYDLIIGNPPYISKKYLSERQRRLSLENVKYFGLREELFQNIWVSFILAAVRMLSSQGAIFFVLPFEFLQVQYAEYLREFLETRFNCIQITTFEDRVFPEIEQDICLVYLSNEMIDKPYIRYKTLISEKNTKTTFESMITRNKPLKKWSNCILNDHETDTLISIADRFPKIRDIAETAPGIVTGANAYFILSKDEISRMNIAEKYYLPIITKGSLLPTLLKFTSNDFYTLAQARVKAYLLNLSDLDEKSFSLGVIEYIREGEEKELPYRYKCKSRRRWYDVPIVRKGEVCFFKRFHNLPRVIVNSANVHTTDIAYNIRLKVTYEPDSFGFCFYNSLTLALCEYNGRFYGGGVGELVPNEFKSLAIPYAKIEEDRIQTLDNMLRTKAPFAEIIDYVDSIVLSNLNDGELELLQSIRNRYLARRLKLYHREVGQNG